MKNNVTLEDIKEGIDKLKSSIAKKQGERDAELKALKKDFKIDSLEEAYSTLDKINAEIDDKSRERARLMKESTEWLEKFGLI